MPIGRRTMDGCLPGPRTAGAQHIVLNQAERSSFSTARRWSRC